MADEKPTTAPVKTAAPKSDEPDLVMEPSKYSGMKIEDAKKQAAIDAKGEDADPNADRSQKMDPADDRPAK